MSAWAQDHPEAHRDHNRAWRAANPDKVAEYNARRRAEYCGDERGVRVVGREKTCTECGRVFTAPTAYRFTCSRECRAKRCEKQRDPLRTRASQHNKNARRRSRKKAGSLTAAEVKEMLAVAVRCPCCGCKMNDRLYDPRQRNIDHVVPLNAGGEHSRENVRVICRGCNLRRPKDGSDVLEILAC